MNRKLILMPFMAFFMLLFSSCEDRVRPITLEKLPHNAQEFISAHFSDLTVSFIKEERNFMQVSYEVVFSNSTKIEFRKDGEWKEVSCASGPVPDSIVPDPVLTYVSGQFPGVYISSIERDRDGTEISLSNFIELKFDRNYNLIDFDS